MINERISDDIPPQMKILNMAIPILLPFCSFISNWSVTACHRTKCDVIFNDVKMFPAVYITGYNVANFWLYPIRSHITKATALELWFFSYSQEKNHNSNAPEHVFWVFKRVISLRWLFLVPTAYVLIEKLKKYFSFLHLKVWIFYLTQSLHFMHVK